MASPAIPQISPGRWGAATEALTHMHADSQIEQRNQQKIRELYTQMKGMPWKPASVVSLHPWTQHAQGPHFNNLVLNAAPMPEDIQFPKIELDSGRKIGYTQHVFTTWGRNLRPNDAGEIEPSAILPIDLALDFIAQHQNSQKSGGLLCFEGVIPIHEMPDVQAFVKADPVGGSRGETLPLKEALEFVHDIQVKHYLHLYEVAEEAWADTDRRKHHAITPNVRKATRLLRAWGVLHADPAWLKVSLKHTVNAGPVICKSCGTEAKPGALKCTNGTCTYVFSPFRAFKELVIDLRTPGAGLALRRLEPKQVNQLCFARIFTREEAEAAGYRFPKKGEKLPDVPDGDAETDEEANSDGSAQ